ncbi:hypothetical protein AJ79_00131 [Helicocarpus griseus UAMH5409]|uniref:Granulins domain-containing protein n=1 Tax=Helicocarpus griseus UAMH5409 TaxID=1447875 RepID=A0A2B7YEQ6_9EURO|nr:hypothetical protein AJ79_00131 [Helicocarpus griseus UAMH5409]
MKLATFALALIPLAGSAVAVQDNLPSFKGDGNGMSVKDSSPFGARDNVKRQGCPTNKTCNINGQVACCAADSVGCCPMACCAPGATYCGDDGHCWGINFICHK